MAKTFQDAPNSVMEDKIGNISILTSYDSNYYTANGEGFGVGSLKPRSIAAQMALYQPYNTTFDTVVQLMGGFEIATKYVHEYFQDDAFWPDEAPGYATTIFDNAKVINNVGGGQTAPYVPATTDVYYILDSSEANKFRAGDTVRYANTNGVYQYAIIMNIGAPNTLTGGAFADNATTQALQLRSVDFDSTRTAQNLLLAAAVDTNIERMFSARGSDLSFNLQSRGSVPTPYKTYVQVAALDSSYTMRAARDKSYINDIARKQKLLMAELKRGRDLMYMYSKGGNFNIPAGSDMGTEGDHVYLADGIWDQIANYNNISFDPTSDLTIRSSLRTLIEQNFGGESGGPRIRQVFGSAKYISDVEYAYENQRRYYSTEYVAGLRVMRYESGLGLVDFIWNPQFEYKHPLVGGSVRSGAGKSVGLMLSVPDNLTRIEYINEGPRMSSFIQQGGEKEEHMRVEVSAGIMLQLKQWAAVHSE